MDSISAFIPISSSPAPPPEPPDDHPPPPTNERERGPTTDWFRDADERVRAVLEAMPGR